MKYFGLSDIINYPLTYNYMNAKLQGALVELRQAGAQGLPSESAVEAAKDGTTWNGKKSNGDPWGLTKNNANSFNCMC